MRGAAWVTLIYAFIIFFGGLMGHLKAGSTVSLATGVVCGFLLFIASLGMFKDRLLPAYFALLLIVLLDAFFTYRWLYTFSFFPAGIMSLISLGALVLIAIMLKKHLKNQQNRR